MSILSARNCCWLVCVFSLALAPAIDAADCNGNETDDQEDLQNGVSEDCNGDSLPDECERGPFNFVPDKIRNIAFPKTLRALETADADGDGDLDFFVAYRPGGSEAPSSVLVIRNEQDVLGPRGGPYPAGTSLRDLKTGDFNGDGKPDVLTGNDLLVHVLLNTGDGSLAQPIDLTPSSETRVVEAVDLTGDGADEVIASSHDGTTLSVFSNDGQGSFGEPVDVAAVEDNFELIGADLDGDGDLDVAAASKDNDTAYTVFLNEGGILTLAATYATGASRFSSFLARDLNGDGRPDFVGTSSRAIALRLNNGDGTLADEIVYSLSVLKGLVIGDFDGDGHVDLATGRRSQGVAGLAHIRFNDGSGNFGLTTEIGLDAFPNFLVSGDFDNDGIADLATGLSDSVTILAQRDGKSSAFDRVDFGPLQGCIDARGCRTHGLAVEDIDGDGDTDVLGSNTHPGSFSILINDGNGGLAAEPARTFGGEHPQAITTGDLDGDGDADAVTCDNLSNDIRVHINNGDGTFQRATGRAIARVGAAPINVRLADFDGDGNLDIAVANEGSSNVSILINSGAAEFKVINPQGERTRRAPKALIPADLDGDGDIDIAVANSGDVFVTILMNDGDATFRPVNIRVDGSPHHVDSADVDGDGDIDLVTANKNTNSASVLLNNGDGTFARSIDVPIGRSPYSAVVVDFDLDGTVDILSCSEDSSSVSVLAGFGDGTFGQPVHIPVGAGPRFIGLADFDGDGDVDLVTNNRQGQSFTAVYNQVSSAAVGFLTSVCTPLDLATISAQSTTGTARSFTKYTMPLGEEPGFPGTVYQNVKAFPLHEEFLAATFPKQFPLLDPDIYDVLVGRRATRRFFVGAISRIPRDGTFVYGFSVFARFNNDVEKLSSEEVKGIYEKLQESFHLDNLAYFPGSGAAKEVAQSWENPGFPILDAPPPIGQQYRAYTIAVGYGRVRIPSRAEFDELNENGLLNPQDIYVLDHSPRDTEGVPAAIFTADEQDALSHLAVRTSRRGTPNAFIADAPRVFEEWEGQLVRVAVEQFEFSIEAASEEEAQDFWERSRPTLSQLPQVDPDFAGLMDLAEVAELERTDDAFPIEARFGGKVSNFARLQTILEGDFSVYRAVGIGIPVHYYLEFMRANRIRSAIDAGRTVTYQEYINELLESDMFRSDSKFRFDALDDLRDAIRDDSDVDGDLVQAVADKIHAVFGTTNERVRTRSSSNVEDAPEFNGAGLYDSTSACPDDDLDGDDRGPSRCEPPDADERGIARGLRRVWRSLWNFRAYEERSFFSIPEDVAAMGVLVSKAFRSEKVNGVAFTGNPRNPRDRRYIIASQAGEASVVSPEPGEVVAKDLLEVVDGEVVQILRVIPSSLVLPGTHVLSDEQLTELGKLLWHIDTNFPIDTGRHERTDFLMDVEFKIDDDDSLAVKQVRPFLLTAPEPEDPDFKLEIPAGTSACGSYTANAKIRNVYELQSIVHFNVGDYVLSGGVESFSAELIAEIELGLDRRVATPTGPGLFTVRKRRTEDPEVVEYEFAYDQAFELAGGESLTVSLILGNEEGFEFAAENGVAVQEGHVVDEEFLTDAILWSEVSLGEEQFGPDYSSCSHEHLPLFEVHATLDDGTSIRLDQKRLPRLQADEIEEPPSSVVAGQVSLAGQTQRTTDYWRLVYTADKHNTHEEFWVALDPPVTVPGLEMPVHVVELLGPFSLKEQDAPPRANYLGPNLEVLASPGVTSFETVEGGTPRQTFRRGDYDGNGSVQIGDAVALVEYLYRDGDPSTCVKTADANDSGTLTVTDAIGILKIAFLPGDPGGGPFAGCATDATPDDLDCVSYGACGGGG